MPTPTPPKDPRAAELQTITDKVRALATEQDSLIARLWAVHKQLRFTRDVLDEMLERAVVAGAVVRQDSER